MALTLRLDKGSPLTHTELDDNFTYLSGSITDSNILLSGSFPADRLIVSADSASATAGGVTTNSQLRTYDGNTSILIGGSQGSFGVNGLGMLIKEDQGSGDHVVLSDGSGSHLRLRAGGGDVGDSYVMIQADQAGFAEEDIFVVAKFGGPNKGTELYHSGSLVFFTDKLSGDKSVYISGSLSGSKDVFFPALPNTTTANIVGFDIATGQLSYYDTGSFGGGSSTDTGSLMLTGSVSNNTLTFTKGDGSTFTLTVDTGSGAGSTDYVSNVTLNGTTLEFTGVGSAFGSGVDLSSLSGGGSTDISALNTFTGSIQTEVDNLTAETSSYLTGEDTGSFLYSGSYDSSTNNIRLYSADQNYDLDLSGLAGGGSGLALTASDEGSELSKNVRSLDFVGNGVVATNSGNAVTVTITQANTSSFVTNTDTGSFYISSSVSNNVITFNQGDGTTESVTVDTGSDTNLGTTDQNLTSARTVTANGSNLTFEFETANLIINSDPGQRVTIANLPTSAESQVVGIDSNGNLKAMNTSSIAGGSPTDISALNTFTGSIQTEVDNLTNATSSYLTNTDTGSFYISSSVSNSTITFTQGDGTTESVTVNNVVNATSASYAPNLFNSNGTLTSNRTLDFGGSSLTLDALNGESFNIAAENGATVSIGLDSSTFEVTGLSTSNQPQVLGISALGVVTAMNTSSIAGGGSTDISALNTFTGSIQTEVNNLTNATSSYLTNTDTGSFYISSSVSNNVITFNQGDGTTESVTVGTGSLDYTIQRAVEFVPNNSKSGATNLELIVGSVRITNGTNTATTTAISQLVGLTLGQHVFVTATLSTTSGNIEAVGVTGISGTGQITFETSANVGETSDIMYHVFKV